MKRVQFAERSRLAFGLARALRNGLTLLALCIGCGLAQASAPIMQLPGQLAVTPSGSLSYSIPIASPTGTAGMVPALSLDYSSQGGNGIVGLSWSLSGLPAIARCPQTLATDGVHGAVRFDANDRFCLDGARLIVISGTDGVDGSEYRTEIESFSKVIAHGTAGIGPAWFEVHTKSGQIMELGNTTDSRILAQGKTSASSWTVNKISDTKGNYLTVTYVNDTTNGQAYPTRIDYTGNAAASVQPLSSIQLVYNTNRPDQVPLYHAGSLMKTTVLLTDIKTYRGTTLVSDYQLTYQLGDNINPSKLTSVRLCAGVSGASCLPATSFTWQNNSVSYSYKGASGVGPNPDGSSVRVIAGDWAGTGRSGLFVQSQFSAGLDANYCCDTSRLLVSDSTGTLSDTGFDPSNWGVDDSGPVYAIDDIDGDGKTDISKFQSPPVRLYRSTGGSFSLVNSSLTPTTATWPWFFDYTGDGRTDYAFTNGQYAGNGNGTFTQTGSAVIPTSEFDPNRSIGAIPAEINGDGKIDLLALDDCGQGTSHCVQSYVSNGTSFSAPLSSGVNTWDISPGDFNGDGLTDFLSFPATGSSVMYLSIGDGSFMATSFAVPSNWSLDSCFTGDINGDGWTDIVEYLATGQYSIWISTGTGFINSGMTLPTPGLGAKVSYPRESLILADFNGDGAADIQLINNPITPLFISSFKRAMITGITTGVGATTSITYGRLTDPAVYTKGSSAAYPTVDVQQARYVVARVDSANGVGGTHSFAYSYSNAQNDLKGRGSLGFGQMKVLDLDPNKNILETTNFRQDYPYIGLVASQTRTQGALTLSTATNSYTTTNLGGTRNLPLLSQSIEAGSDLDGTALPTITTSYQYDSYGNKTQIAASRSDGSAKTTNNSYSNNATSWILGRLTATSVTNDFPHTAPGGTNRPPVAVNDNKSTHAGVALTFDPRANDSEPDGDPLTITAKTDGAHGFVQILSGGTQIKFTPTAGYVGTDSFTYTISDGLGGFATATVAMTMGNTAPSAVNDTMAVSLNTAASLDPRTNDTDADGDALTITAKTDGAHGTVAITGGGAGITYTPANGYTGADSFTYTIADGNGGTATGTANVTVSTATVWGGFNWGAGTWQ
jgi:hypothetical protein